MAGQLTLKDAPASGSLATGHAPPQTPQSLSTAPCTAHQDGTATEPPESSSGHRSGSHSATNPLATHDPDTSPPSLQESPTPVTRKRKVNLRPFPVRVPSFFTIDISLTVNPDDTQSPSCQAAALQQRQGPSSTPGSFLHSRPSHPPRAAASTFGQHHLN